MLNLELPKLNLEPPWRLLDSTWNLLDASWAQLGASWAEVGRSWAKFGPSWSISGAFATLKIELPRANFGRSGWRFGRFGERLHNCDRISAPDFISEFPSKFLRRNCDQRLDKN